MKLNHQAKSVKRPFKRAVAVVWLVVALALNLWGPALAAEKDKEIPYPEFKTGSGFSQALQRITGITAVSGWVANRVVRRELSRYLDGPIHSRLKLFSATDLLAGKARRLSIHGENLVYADWVPLSEFSLESDHDFPLYVKKGKKPFLLRPVKLKLHAVMSESDLNRMLQSEKGRNLLTAMKLDIPPFGRQELDVLAPQIRITGDKLMVKTRVNKHESAPEKALPIEITAGLYAEKSRLKLSNIGIYVEGLGEAREVARLVENYFADLVDLSKIKVDRHKLKIAFDQTRVADGRVLLDATVTVTPDAKLIRALAAQ